MGQTGKAILIIDMQNDFVLPDAPLCVDGAMITVKVISEFLDFGRSKGWLIVFVCRQHRPSGIDAERFRRHLFTKGNGICTEGSKGAEIVDGLKPHCQDIIVIKKRFDAFFHTDLETILRSAGVEEVYITGTQYPNCVRSTAVGAMERDYAVTVVTDCCSAATPEIAYANIEDMSKMGIQCVTSKYIIKSDSNEI